jgi:hypothetical protein
LSAEEERRVSEQRKQLRSTMEELASIERAVIDANKNLFDDRNRAIMEMGQLNQAKQNAQSQMLMVSEAQRRLAMKTTKESNSSTLSPLSLLVSSDDTSNNNSSSQYPSKFEQDARKLIQGSKIKSNSNTNSNSTTNSNEFIKNEDTDIQPMYNETRGILGLGGKVSARTPFVTSVPLMFSGLTSSSNNYNDNNNSKSSDIDKLHMEVSKLRAQSTSILNNSSSSTNNNNNNNNNNNDNDNDDRSDNDRRSKAMQSFFSKSTISLN